MFIDRSSVKCKCWEEICRVEARVSTEDVEISHLGGAGKVTESVGPSKHIHLFKAS